ncbi:hypothetical protein ACWNX6_00520 [Candidatus Vidania fulgoroideorum]
MKKKILIKNKNEIMLEKKTKETLNGIIKLIYIIKRSIKKKKKTLLICKKKHFSILKKKLKNCKYLYIYDNFYNGFLTNNKKKINNIKNIISLEINSNYIFNEIKKKKIRGILISNNKTTKSEPDFHLVLNCNEKNILFLINQLVQIIKKNSFNKPFFTEKKLYYYCKKINSRKIFILVIRIEQDLFLKKKYFNFLIKKILKKSKNKKKNLFSFIRGIIKKISIFYNENIKIINFKFIKSKNYISFYLHNNKKLSFCIHKRKKKTATKMLMNFIALENEIDQNLLKNNYIFDETKKIRDIILETKTKKIFFVK